MKRCIICGNVGDGNSTACEKCGNPYVDMPAEEVTAEAAVQEPEVQENKEIVKEDKTEAAKQPAERRPQGAPRRRVSGPQIYGQGAAPDQMQGAVRRNVPGRVPQNMNGRPMNGPQGAPAGRPMNGPQGAPVRPSYNSMQMMEAARKAIKSPLFVIIALLNTVYLVSSVAAIFLKELNFSVIARLLSDVELPNQFIGYMDKFLVMMAKLDTDAIIANLIMRVPDLLFCLGLWMILITAFAAKEKMAGIGFVFTKIVLIINMVKNCVVVLAGLIVSVALAVAAWVSGTKGMTVASVVTLVLMIIIAMMVIMYYFCYMATFKTVRFNANGEEYGKVSGYVAVMEVILALTAILNLLSGIVNAEISAIAGAVSKMGWMILFALWILSYKKRMSEFEEEA